MVPTDSDNNPDKRSRAKPENYLENWIERQSLVESMIPVIGGVPMGASHAIGHVLGGTADVPVSYTHLTLPTTLPV